MSQGCVGFECKFFRSKPNLILTSTFKTDTTELDDKLDDQSSTDVIQTTDLIQDSQTTIKLQKKENVSIGQWVGIAITTSLVVILIGLIIYYRNYIYCGIDCPQNSSEDQLQNQSSSEYNEMARYSRRQSENSDNETVELNV